MLTYLESLTIRLARGVADLPESIRARHARYLKAAQRRDGGFAGREGDSDLYYTAFALRSLSVLGELQGEVAEQSAAYLRSRWMTQGTMVELTSLIYGVALLDVSAGIDVFTDRMPGWRETLADAVEHLRRDDGGYAKGPAGAAGSTYSTFLALIGLELLQRAPERPQRIIAFILSQCCAEGGFREIRVSKRAGTNPTAAAIGALQILHAMRDDVRDSTIELLVEMQTDEGGLRANTRIPLADLLSTFTGCLTLVDLEAIDQVDVDAARRFVALLQREEGGFHGATWDTGHDVEYTFYGLGCLALLNGRL